MTCWVKKKTLIEWGVTRVCWWVKRSDLAVSDLCESDDRLEAWLDLDYLFIVLISCYLYGSDDDYQLKWSTESSITDHLTRSYQLEIVLRSANHLIKESSDQRIIWLKNNLTKESSDQRIIYSKNHLITEQIIIIWWKLMKEQEFLNFAYERCHQGMTVLKSFYM